MRRLAAIGLALILAAPGAVIGAARQPPPAGFGAYKPVAGYSESVTTSFYVPMRDGTRIAMSLIRPAIGGKAAPGRFPVIWHATLDIGTSGGSGLLPGLARQGYNVVIVARRGNGASFGVRRGYEDFTDSFDHYELIEWLAAQPWSDGKVGMYGCSNTGEAVMHALTARPPHLKAAFAGCFSWDRFDGHARGGIIANYGTGPQRTLEQDMTATPVEGDKDKRQLRQAAEEHMKSTDLFELMRGMPYRDSFSPLVMSKFWSETSIGDLTAMVRQGNVPLYIQGGWYDDFRAQAFITMASLPGQARVVIGPWRHCRNGDFDLQSEMLRFFDHYLKGRATGIEKGDAIQYFTINAPAGKEWRSTSKWPLPNAAPTAYLLAGERFASDAAPAPARKVTADYKAACPRDPQGGGPFEQPCHPATGAVFTGPPLDRDTEVTGSPIADVWIASTREDAHVFAYLEDIAPDGSLAMVSEGRLKASLRKLNQPAWNNAGLPWHRSYVEDEQKLKPGEPVEMVFDLLPTSYIFRKGHRLQVTIAGSDPRERIRVPGEAPVISILAEPGRMSKVMLPIVR